MMRCDECDCIDCICTETAAQRMVRRQKEEAIIRDMAHQSSVAKQAQRLKRAPWRKKDSKYSKED